MSSRFTGSDPERAETTLLFASSGPGLVRSLLTRQPAPLWRFRNQLAPGQRRELVSPDSSLTETDFRFENRRGWIRFRIMTKVAIVGANGYSGEELCAILARHPRVKIASVTSRQHAGKRVTDVLVRLTGLSGISSLVFSEPSIEELLASGADFVFLALPHGLASEFAAPLIEAGKKVVDLSADFPIAGCGCLSGVLRQRAHRARASYGSGSRHSGDSPRGDLPGAPGGFRGMLSNQHSPSPRSVVEGRPHQAVHDHCQQRKWSKRRRAQDGSFPDVRRMP